MERAESRSRSGDAAGAAPDAREAAEKLAAAAGAAKAKGAAERAKAEKELQRLAERQKENADAMKRLAERLRAEKDLPGAAEAADALDRAASSSGESMRGGGEEARGRTRKGLEEARESLRDPKLEERRKEMLKDPLREQEKLSGETKQLAKDMAGSGDGGGSESAAGASESMDRASEDMEKGDPESAAEDQKEAERRLEEIRRELDREQTRYENLRQEELLFRIAKELDALVEGQSAVNLRVRDVDDKRAAADGTLSRFDLLSLGEIGDREKELAGKAGWIADSIEKEESPVYGFVMRSIAEDMDRLAALLLDRETGSSAQVLGSEVVRRLQELAAALKKQKEEAAKAPPPPEGQPQEQKNPLVPPPAELRMLKSLQEEVNASVEDLRAELATGADLSEDARREVDRLARRQSRLRDLWLTLAKKFGLPTEEEAPAGGEGGGEPGGGESGR